MKRDRLLAVEGLLNRGALFTAGESCLVLNHRRIEARAPFRRVIKTPYYDLINYSTC